jgi:N-acetylglucosamine-6-sulfatase
MTNAIFILADDMRADDILAMPNLRQYIGAEGVNGGPAEGIKFDRCTVANPLCSPSRTCGLTGLYTPEQPNPVWNNQLDDGQGVNGIYPMDGNTLFTWLNDAGVRTLLAGKYMNGKGETGDIKPQTYVPPGLTDARILQDGTYLYNGPTEFNQNGNIGNSGGAYYSTEWIRDRALARIDDWHAGPQPFFMWLGFVACHNQAPVSKNHAGESNVGHVESNCYKQAEPSDVPWIANNTPAMDDWDIQERRKRLDCLRDLDDAIKAIRDRLVQYGIMDDTLIIFMSDNGFLLGEHGLRGKTAPYEPSIKVPLMVRWTHGPSSPATGVRTRRVSSLDIVPTICSALGVKPGRAVQGRSLYEPQLPSGVFRPVFFDGHPRPDKSDIPNFSGILVDKYKLVNYEGTTVQEFFNLDLTPDECNNEINNPAYTAIRDSMQAELDLRNAGGYDYTGNWSPPA